MMTASGRLGKYEILEELGRGGFAVVYKARDTTLDRVVALKVLHPHWAVDFSFAARFKREARAAAQLRNTNIVTVYETDEAKGELYIAMEYLPGQTLQDLLEAKNVLPLERATIPPYLRTPCRHHLTLLLRDLLADGTGSITLILRRDILDAFPGRDQLAAGARVEVIGEIQDHNGELTIIPATEKGISVIQ
jgi:hypothetical protein